MNSKHLDRGQLFHRGLMVCAVTWLSVMVASCESYVRARAFEQHAPLREGSVASWVPREIEGEQSLAWLMQKTSIVVGRADFVGLKKEGQRKLTLKPMRAGSVARPSLGSAVAVSADGYFLTAAHCIVDEPYVVVAMDREGNFVERLGRTVWNGLAGGGRTDVALIHAPDLHVNPIAWCVLEDAKGGAEVLSAGVGVGASSRLAGGRITGGPIGSQEAAAGRALAFQVDSPLIAGDSGGPTILESGGLVGVCANVEIELFAQAGGGEVLRPDPEFIRSLIAADRAARGVDTLDP